MIPINQIVKNKTVIMTKGDFKKRSGKWLGITGYSDTYGAVCKIDIDGTKYEFTSDFFMFADDTIQAKWDNDDYDFKIDMK